MITVLNLGTANIGSVLNMLRRIRVPATVAEGAQDIEKATKIIMPGVGHFSNSVERLAQGWPQAALLALDHIGQEAGLRGDVHDRRHGLQEADQPGQRGDSFDPHRVMRMV